METKYLNDEFDIFWQKILNNENFAFMRNADGERAIMTGKSVAAQEGNWKSPDYVTALGKAIFDSLQIDDPNVYYAISCPCCDEPAYNWYRSRIKNKNITFANLWINSNYPKFRDRFPHLNRDAILIANYRAEGKKIGGLNIIKYYTITDDCISFWENNADELLEKIKSEYGNTKNLLYVVSAGPMSGPIIANLFKNNPDNCYVDFGSSIDVYYRGYITRPYMKSNNIYAKRNCWMHKNANLEPCISVVCTLFKKPESLIKQLKAIKDQTIKPLEILLFQDCIPNDYTIVLQGSLRKQFDGVCISNVNAGVWERFNYARKAMGKYICLFDDDTIPGPRWLEHCFNNMINQEGIYGTIGIVLTHGIDYPINNFFKVGWDNPLPETVEVDFVGHSWFFKREWLEYMFEDTEQYQRFKYVAEDMCLSFQALKHGVKTFVPAHPYFDKDLWGSNPESAKYFGTAPGAVSTSNRNMLLMNDAIKLFFSNGWLPLYKRNSKYIEKLFFRASVVNGMIIFLIRVFRKFKRMLKIS